MVTADTTNDGTTIARGNVGVYIAVCQLSIIYSVNAYVCHANPVSRTVKTLDKVWSNLLKSDIKTENRVYAY